MATPVGVDKKLLYPRRAGNGKAGRRMWRFAARLIRAFFLLAWGLAAGAVQPRNLARDYFGIGQNRFVIRPVVEGLARLDVSVYRNSLVLCANRHKGGFGAA
ncbi:hypothetical protein [Desulfovibrio intestinalis]|uniref:Uncharacterized protein n=1 Tax=Desulfovibrio intestinalis TaxID=58621 RepID=A0A7W8FI36_9BACT|nr:hypothetical protein [Desulfovibrio intestinalis]MBB5144482.1 hypothetical protein [Desulfovibrio intestinalis]